MASKQQQQHEPDPDTPCSIGVDYHKCFMEQAAACRKTARCYVNLHRYRGRVDKTSIVIEGVPWKRALKIVKRFLEVSEQRALVTTEFACADGSSAFTTFGQL